MEQRLIDANALYEEFNHNPNGTKIRGDATVEVVLVRQKIRYAPTVDAVPVGRGLWIADRKIAELYHCSICGFVDHREPKARYCSDCGAKMEGGE